MQVLPVHHGIDGERQVELARPFRGVDLLVVRILEPGDAVGNDGLIALKADLHMAKPGIGQRRKLFLGQQHRRGNQVGIEPDVGRVLHQFGQILACGRLAAGEMDLQHADFGKLGQNLLPFLGRRARFRRGRARPGSSNRGIAAGSGGSVRQAPQAECHRFRGEPRASSVASPSAPVTLMSVDSRAHDVFSRASVRKPLSARSCSMATTSVGSPRAARRIWRPADRPHRRRCARRRKAAKLRPQSRPAPAPAPAPGSPRPFASRRISAWRAAAVLAGLFR